MEKGNQILDPETNMVGDRTSNPEEPTPRIKIYERILVCSGVLWQTFAINTGIMINKGIHITYGKRVWMNSHCGGNIDRGSFSMDMEKMFRMSDTILDESINSIFRFSDINTITDTPHQTNPWMNRSS